MQSKHDWWIFTETKSTVHTDENEVTELNHFLHVLSLCFLWIQFIHLFIDYFNLVIIGTETKYMYMNINFVALFYYLQCIF